VQALCEAMRRYAPPLGRLLLALIFLISGWGKIFAFGATAAAMAKRGMPLPEILLVAAIAIELGAGALLVLGWKTRAAAVALLVFLVPATLYFHNYWTFPPAEQRNQRNHFLKNVAIGGALLFILGTGAGSLSLDERRARRRATVRGTRPREVDSQR
jgi:putative oxidoreductase